MPPNTPTKNAPLPHSRSVRPRQSARQMDQAPGPCTRQHRVDELPLQERLELYQREVAAQLPFIDRRMFCHLHFRKKRFQL
ncbi:GL12971 [Drosophila persimilis]|uniref:GL12971 n=1 Tax=Drosophila persimilis TaxID=7234 RepID=B4GVH3_DROPE|nr:GL12971 [Drosophila persimilis]